MKINFSGCFDETFYSEYSMSLGNQILISKKEKLRVFFINMPRLTKDVRVWICLEYMQGYKYYA
jgi:hypothetical protein